MIWLEKKYILLLSSQLPHFKQKSDNLFNFRCVLCGDSKTNKNKTRGYIYFKSGRYIYHCHNCNASHNFITVFKKINPALYDQYLQEKLSQDTTQPTIEIEKVVVKNSNKYLNDLKKVSQLNAEHPCKKYVVSRQIPSTIHYKLYYCSKFKEWTNTIIPDKFSKTDLDYPRLIIPLFWTDGTLIGYQGRALHPKDTIRYITIMLDETKPRVYGLDTTDFNHKYYIFEGPIDSMFIPNSIATCGGQLTREMDLLKKNVSNAVVVYDNEPRNKDIVRNILTAINSGYKVCLWPPSLEQKDVNEMILKKVSGSYCKTEVIQKAGKYIKNIIDDNTFQGLEAELKFSSWRKV
jgi:transcription elongation factor Elf1